MTVYHANKPPLGKKGVKKASRKSVKKTGTVCLQTREVARFSFYGATFSLFCLRGRFLRTFCRIKKCAALRKPI